MSFSAEVTTVIAAASLLGGFVAGNVVKPLIAISEFRRQSRRYRGELARIVLTTGADLSDVDADRTDSPLLDLPTRGGTVHLEVANNSPHDLTDLTLGLWHTGKRDRPIEAEHVGYLAAGEHLPGVVRVVLPEAVVGSSTWADRLVFFARFDDPESRRWEITLDGRTKRVTRARKRD